VEHVFISMENVELLKTEGVESAPKTVWIEKVILEICGNGLEGSRVILRKEKSVHVFLLVNVEELLFTRKNGYTHDFFKEPMSIF